VHGSLAGGGCWAQLLYCVRLDVSPFVACLRPCFDNASQAKLLWRLLFAPWLSCAVQQFQCAAAHVSACSCGPVLGAVHVDQFVLMRRTGLKLFVCTLRQ
jgi:hypothetical protein